MAQVIVVTGANRGIGLSLCHHYNACGANVYGVCRQSSEALDRLGVQVIEGVDISDSASLKKLDEGLSDAGVDILINNAGILCNDVLGQFDYDTITRQFLVNSLGPLRVTECLLPKLKPGAKIAMITSRMGSIDDNTSGGRYGYRMSKCALNIASVSLARDLADQSIAVGIFHPGLVGTEMIGGYGDVTPDEAAGNLARRIEDLSMKTSGEFVHANGQSLPW